MALILTFGSTTVGWAAKTADAAEIPMNEETGITAFDSVFLKVKAIHDTLVTTEGRTTASQDEIAAALGLPTAPPEDVDVGAQAEGGDIGDQRQVGDTWTSEMVYTTEGFTLSI